MVGDRFFAKGKSRCSRKNWRVILVTLLAANLVFMGLLSLQRLEMWRTEQEYFKRIQQPSTERYEFLAKELAEAKMSETMYLDSHLIGAGRVERSHEQGRKSYRTPRANGGKQDQFGSIWILLKAAVDRMSAAKP